MRAMGGSGAAAGPRWVTRPRWQAPRALPAGSQRPRWVRPRDQQDRTRRARPQHRRRRAARWGRVRRPPGNRTPNRPAPAPRGGCRSPHQASWARQGPRRGLRAVPPPLAPRPTQASRRRGGSRPWANWAAAPHPAPPQRHQRQSPPHASPRQANLVPPRHELPRRWSWAAHESLVRSRPWKPEAASQAMLQQRQTAERSLR